MKTPMETELEENLGISPPGSLVWFEIPADNVERAKSFYSTLFGWKLEKFPGAMEYWHIDTGGPEGAPDGGLMQRQHPQHGITHYISVPSVDQFMEKVKTLGGTIIMPRTAVPQMGYFAICQDPEHNTFGIWETDVNAK